MNLVFPVNGPGVEGLFFTSTVEFACLDICVQAWDWIGNAALQLEWRRKRFGVVT